jgi:hypothetical protein
MQVAEGLAGKSFGGFTCEPYVDAVVSFARQERPLPANNQ